MRQAVLLGAPVRRQVAKQLGVHEPLTECALGYGQQREEEHAWKQGRQERVQKHE